MAEIYSSVKSKITNKKTQNIFKKYKIKWSIENKYVDADIFWVSRFPEGNILWRYLKRADALYHACK